MSDAGSRCQSSSTLSQRPLVCPDWLGLAPSECPENLKHIKTDGRDHLTDSSSTEKSETDPVMWCEVKETRRSRVSWERGLQYGNVCVSLQLLSLAFIMKKFIILRAQDHRTALSRTKERKTEIIKYIKILGPYRNISGVISVESNEAWKVQF